MAGDQKRDRVSSVCLTDRPTPAGDSDFFGDRPVTFSLAEGDFPEFLPNPLFEVGMGVEVEEFPRKRGGISSIEVRRDPFFKKGEGFASDPCGRSLLKTDFLILRIRQEGEPPNFFPFENDAERPDRRWNSFSGIFDGAISHFENLLNLKGFLGGGLRGVNLKSYVIT